MTPRNQAARDVIAERRLAELRRVIVRHLPREVLEAIVCEDYTEIPLLGDSRRSEIERLDRERGTDGKA
jgi:hypothetical protein